MANAKGLPTEAPPAVFKTGQSPWRNRIVGSGEEKPDQLLANPKNWRIHPRPQQEALAGVLDEVGWVQQVLVNKRTGCVVDGHLRVSLALRREEQSVPVLYVDLDEAEEALILATLDPLSAMAKTDKEQLEHLLAEVRTENAGVNTLLDDIAPPLSIQEQVAELEITPELYERHDYLVILFDNMFDWNVVCEKLGVHVVKNVPIKGSSLSGAQSGRGRVIKAEDFLKAIGK